MEPMAELNLDQLAAKHAQGIILDAVDGPDEKTRLKQAGDMDNTVTKTLGILQSDGVYACFLYLFSKEQPQRGTPVVRHMLKMLHEMNINLSPAPAEQNGKPDLQAVMTFVSDNVTADLGKLLLVKEMLEQMLIYARYSAKARAKNG